MTADRTRTPLMPPEHFESGILAALIVALIAASVFMLRLGEPMVNSTNPTGIVGYELAGSYERASAILDSWDETARAAARNQTIWDYFLYIPVYVLALSTWAGWCARRLSSGRLARLGVVLAWAMFAAGILDVAENMQLMWQLDHTADGRRAALAAIFAWPKFLIVYATLAYVLIGTVMLAARRIRPGD